MPATAVARTPIAIERLPAPQPDVQLMRAAAEIARDSVHRVIEQLEPIDWDSPGFPGADRAAFLLAEAYVRAGAPARLIALGRRLERWPAPTASVRWVVQRARLAALEQGDVAQAAPPVSAADADAIAGAARLRAADAAGALALVPDDGPRSALALALRARALAATGGDDRAALEALVTADTLTLLGRELSDAARIVLASRALANGADPTAWLSGVTPDGILAGRAAHLAGLRSLEAGQSAAGRAALERALVRLRNLAETRAVRSALGGHALDQGDWPEAHRQYALADSSWSAQWESLGWLEARGSAAELWPSWTRAAADFGSTWLQGEADDAAWRARIAEASDLRRAFAPGDSHAEVLASGSRPAVEALPPTSEEWQRLGTLRGAALAAMDSLTRARAALHRERSSLSRLRDYLRLGLTKAAGERDAAAQTLARLDSLAAALFAIDARLRALRDASIERLQARTRAIRLQAEAQQRWIAGIERMRLAGPDSLRVRWAPQGHIAPPGILGAERELAASLDAACRAMAEETPERIRASYERAWRPGLIDGVLAQQAVARAALARAQALEHGVDSSLAAAASSADERALRAELPPLEQRVHQTQTEWLAAQKDILASSIRRTREALVLEREGIDYGLAVSAYAASLGGERLAAAPGTSGATRGRAGAEASDALDAALEAPESAAWRERGIAGLERFLAAHAASPARAEMRFRLADLRMIGERQRFRERMATFLRQPADHRVGAPPVADHSASLALYRAILREDPGFELTDAALFNAALILSEEGAPEARTMFEQLIAEHPGSVHRQESLLRLGDMAFADGRLTESVPLYEGAAQGPDAGLRVMALYKQGWAHFNEDRFPAAARSFGAVLDLYALHPEAAGSADLADESETYLVHALAGAGGAAAYEAHFAAGDARGYALRVLLALGQHFRRYGELVRAAEVDRLCLLRHPDHPEALTSAMRLVETLDREGDAVRTEAGRLEVAPRFAPRSAWARSQSTDSLRIEGERFARETWLRVAQRRHRIAREKGALEDWRLARDLYDRVVSAWPADPDAALLRLHLGEAEARLGNPSAALAHYRAAAESDRDSIRTRARWERIAVNDAWYERTRAGRSTGSDSLARAVREAAADLLERDPEHPQAADIRWRRAQLARAHGWNDEAVADLDAMVREHPTDRRASEAAMAKAEALFALERFDEAGGGFETARRIAALAGRDSLSRAAARATPVSWHRFAEASVAADSQAHLRHAERFSRIAHEWPDYPQAPATMYRAGIAYLAAGRTDEGVRELSDLAARFPTSTPAREARLRIAKAWEEAARPRLAAEAYLAFAQAHPGDPGAAPSWLHAADLRSAAGDSAVADSLRLGYLAAHPADHETALEVMESLARRELAGLGDRPLSALLPPAPTGRSRPAPASHLARYLALARQHPAAASRDLLAEVRFRHAEEAMASYQRLRLTLPLKRSIAVRQAGLDTVLARYRRAAGEGVALYAQAAACRIGEAIEDFAIALERSDRPADLKGDDRLAYEDVLLGQAHGFRLRAQDVWTDLLRRSSATPDTPWVVRARESLWKGLGTRFFYRPEVEFPVVPLKRIAHASATESAPAAAEESGR